MHLQGKYCKKKYHSYRGDENRNVPNIIRRDFYAEAPLMKITTDVSQFDLGFCRCYLAPVIDMFNNEVLSWDLSLSPNMEQQKRMLEGLLKSIRNQTNAT